jgi:hypothetical protein
MNNQRFRFNYTETDKDSGDTKIDLDLTFENPKDLLLFIDAMKKHPSFGWMPGTPCP